MIEQELQRKIEDFRELGIPAYFPREGGIHVLDRMVSTVAHRAGRDHHPCNARLEMVHGVKLGQTMDGGELV